MLHEIQPGDFVIITVPISVSKSELKYHWNDTMKSGAGVHFVHSTAATETSVHVIRAKKAEDTPKPDWPAWRDVRVENPPDGKPLLVWNSAFGGRIELGFLPKNPQSRYTHWMPLPEGPKS